MKTLKLVLLGFVLSFSLFTKAQVNVNVNIGTPPVWGPVGYTEARYYYIPDIETYYDISAGMFVYMGPRGWIHARVLPRMYSHFDLYNGYKVVLNFRGDNPYRYYEIHKTKFPKGYKNHKQKPFKMKHDNGNHSGHFKKVNSKSGNAIHFNDNSHGGKHDKGGGGKGHGHGKGK